MKKIDGLCETQSQFQKRLEQIKKQCEEATKTIRQGLLEGSAIQMSNKIIMGIYNDIFKLAEDSSSLQASKVKQSDKIENQLVECFKKFLKDFIQDIQAKVDESQKDKENVLQIICKTYHDYKAYSFWLYKMFFYLDKFAMPTKGTSLCGTSLQLLKEGYFEKNKGIILNTIQQFIFETRKNRILFDKQIKQLVELFSVMGSKDADLKYFKDKGQYDYLPKNNQEAEQYYKQQFLHPLIVETEKFYKVEIEARQTFTTPEYVDWGNSIFQLELDMCRECYAACEHGIENKLIILLIKEQASTLINSKTGVGLMLQDDRKEELKSLYQFILKGKEVKHFAKAYQQYFEQQGMLINSINFETQTGKQDGRQTNPAELYFQKILEIMEKAQIIMKEQLNEDADIQKSYSGAFSLVINKNDKSPLWLAIFTDIIIRSEKGTNEIELDRKLGKVVQLFQLLYQRDVFFKHYQKFLSMRLLNQQSQNLQLEKQLLQKFKGETGTNVLTQLSSMINDIEQSLRFGQDKNFSKDTNFEFQVNLLSQGSWPINIIIDKINCPLQIESALQIYQNAYLKQHSGRIVTWCYNLGQGEVVYKISNEKYYLSANTLQIIAFMSFNQGDQFTIKELLELTNIEKTELENCLIPFVCLKVLARQKQDIEEFNDANEIIKINVTFNNKAKKMRMLPNPKMQPQRQKVKLENVEEQQQLEQINKQREFVIDSQLVRLMKTKKTIKHHELVENCLQMITLFKPDVVFIKKRIENLIEREYIRRDEKDWNIYHYMN